MAVNPMQRKARLSFILGFFVMFIIAAIVGALLYMQILNFKKEEQIIDGNAQIVYRLKSDIKSGNEITMGDIEKVAIQTFTIKEKDPTKAGSKNVSDYKKTSVLSNIPSNDLLDETDFMESMETKTDLPKGIILSKSMITLSNEKITNDVRVQEYNMLLLPSDLSANDYIDIRLQYPNGQNYIVISRKRVISASQNTIFLKMTEAEIQTMTNAIVESYMLQGSVLYANKFEDAGIQKAATPTYNTSREVMNLMLENPNIADKAKETLATKFNQNRRAEVDTIFADSTVNQGNSGVQTGIETQIQKQNSERTKYIDSLGMGTSTED